MNVSNAPRLATWLLERLAPQNKRESLIGDLVEQYQSGRSATWYWQQVLMALILGIGTDLRNHKLMAVRALVICWAALFLLFAVTGALQQSFVDWARAAWQPELLRQLWVYYRLPFVILTCVGCFAIGWMIARLHSQHREAMLMLCALSLLLPATMWGLETTRLLQAGLWPFWDFRLALIFTAAFAFVGYPLCMLMGGLWTKRYQSAGVSHVAVH